MPEAWEELKFDQQVLLLETMDTKALAKKFKRDALFFEHMRKFVDEIPEQRVAPRGGRLANRDADRSADLQRREKIQLAVQWRRSREGPEEQRRWSFTTGTA